ncbi:hypothetical protein EDD29_7070 [Actinocorallia herbida]|uniref:Uncharacterized protein n=1 Tax=Actinocorallia herbida TaxID=58109 RepID=A0A3N1D783_9ACTN|nr:hypothetical protein [Actinocorallia herbida]ROO89380.1 hypothetical protein EDD29_7070 [Actinocorallia herbida]
MRGWRVVSVGLKVALVILLGMAVAFPEWERFADKAMGARAVAYPLAALLVPAVWWVRKALRKAGPFPWDVDALLTAPFVIDVAGNAADLYDSVSWFDDFCHFFNWVLLVSAAGVALRRASLDLPRWTHVLLCAGIGAIAAIGWEIAEYGAFILDTPESVGIYRDTLGDEALGTLGALCAGLITAWIPRREPEQTSA